MTIELPKAITITKHEIIKLFGSTVSPLSVNDVLSQYNTTKEKDKWRKRIYQAASEGTLTASIVKGVKYYGLSEISLSILKNIDSIEVRPAYAAKGTKKPAKKPAKKLASIEPMQKPIILSRTSESVVDSIAAMSNENSALITFLINTRDQINTQLIDLGVIEKAND